MDQISNALTVVIAVSVAVERVVEILKQMFPPLATEQSDPTKENLRRAALQLLAAVVGAVIAGYGGLQLGAMHTGVATDVLIGLMASGGSGFWNHALDAMRAMKVSKEAAANEQVALSRQVTANAAAGVAAVK